MKNLFLVVALLLPSVSQARVPDWWRKVGWVEGDGADDAHKGVARLAVRGPVKLRLHGLAADVEVISGTDKQVIARLEEGDGTRVTFREDGDDRLELLFDGSPTLRCGRLCVEVPRSSAVDIITLSGDVVVRGVDGAVQARTISGDVEVIDAAGEVRAQTVSGDLKVENAPKLRALSTSGDVSWNGACGSGCRIEAHTLSGDVELRVDLREEKSGFALHYVTHSGEVSDDLGLAFTGARPPRESNLRARRGGGEGVMEVQSISGDLHLARAK